MNATVMIWLTPGALPTALSASATILTPTSLPFAIDTRPLPRNVCLILSQLAPLPVATTLPVSRPCTALAVPTFCERSACSRFRFCMAMVLIIGTAPGVTYLASDIPAILDRATAFYAVNDDEIVRLGPEGFRAIDLDGVPVRLHQLTIDWDLETAEKGGHDDFMSKEINEQPEALRATLLDRRRKTARLPLTSCASLTTSCVK